MKPEAKAWYQSRGMWGAVLAALAALAAAVVALLVHFGKLEAADAVPVGAVVEAGLALAASILAGFGRAGAERRIGATSPRGSVRLGLLLALVLASFVGVAVLEGCAPGYSQRMDARYKVAIRNGSSRALDALPGSFRLFGKGQWWAEPTASTVEAWAPALKRAAEAAMSECVDPGPMVAEVLAGLVKTLAAWWPASGGGITPQEVVALLAPMLEGAVYDLWPYEVGACPYKPDPDVEVFELDVPERFEVFEVFVVPPEVLDGEEVGPTTFAVGEKLCGEPPGSKEQVAQPGAPG
jgi:hypothetical protein